MSTPALADMPSFDQGTLLATGGVSQVEGAGGGGLASWALVTGYGTDNGVGAKGTRITVSFTRAATSEMAEAV